MFLGFAFDHVRVVFLLHVWKKAWKIGNYSCMVLTQAAAAPLTSRQDSQ
jgi:hypothetical protein